MCLLLTNKKFSKRAGSDISSFPKLSGSFWYCSGGRSIPVISLSAFTVISGWKNKASQLKQALIF